jgi:hypothetical protein
MTYAELLKHPKWQEKRLRIFDMAGFKCARCGSGEDQLHAHHKIYFKGRRPWDYADNLLECLCDACHNATHAQKEELDMIIAEQPTSMLPAFTDAVTAAITNDRADPAMPPKLRAAIRDLTAAINGSNETAMVNALNALQDVVDEFRDLRRGPGGAWREAA